jgi:FkbM family methyltransferase
MRGTRPLFIVADSATVGSRTLVAGYEDVPSGDSGRAHMHLEEDEILFVHRGEMEILLGDSAYRAAAGAPGFEKCLRALSAPPGEQYVPLEGDGSATGRPGVPLAAQGSMSGRQPSRLLKRWLRSLVGRDVFQLRQCSVNGEVLGNRGAQWFVSTDDLGPAAVMYSFGVGRDISFERALIERFGVTVHAFDPTPLALEWVRSQRLPDRLVLHELGLADYDGTARFLPSHLEGGENFSMVRTTGIGDPIEAPVRRFATLVALVGAVPELVKLDIEGTEYAVLPDILASGFRPRQLLVEFHHRWREVRPARTREAIRLLNRNHYRVADVSAKGKEYTFVLRP